MTVGTVLLTRKTMRLIDGSVSSVVLSRTSPVDAFDVSMSGASATTVIRLFNRADLEHDVEREELLRADPHILALERLEPGDRRANGVNARRHARERVLAGAVAGSLARDAGLLIDQRHRCARDDTLRVLHRPSQTALE